MKKAVTQHLTQRHELKAFTLIRWFHPNVVKCLRTVPDETVPTSQEMSSLFNNAVVIDPAEWNRYVTCTELLEGFRDFVAPVCVELRVIVGVGMLLCESDTETVPEDRNSFQTRQTYSFQIRCWMMTPLAIQSL